MKSLIFLATLIPVTASAERRTYDVNATRRATSDGTRSCGALSRMMKDRHVLTVDEENGLVAVNGFRWHVASEEPDLLITFHDRSGQLTWLSMDLYVNMQGLSGRYTLHGIIRDVDDPLSYEQCEDTVYVDGSRR